MVNRQDLKNLLAELSIRRDKVIVQMEDLEKVYNEIDEQIKKTEEEFIEFERVRKSLPDIVVGQIYEVDYHHYGKNDRGTVMVVAIGSGGVGLTFIDSRDAGCWSPAVGDGSYSYSDMKERLIELNAKYLGTFGQLYQLKKPC